MAGVQGSSGSVLRGVRVLVVDDDHDVLELLGHMLGAYEVVVATATSGNKGFAKFVEWRPDVLISDVHMRGGMLTIEWPTDDANVLMTGPAETVFEGEIEL